MPTNRFEHFESEPLSSLEEQYANPRRIDIDGETLEIFDLRPETLKTETPAMVVPGVGGTAEMMKENLIGLASKGRRVIVGSAAHGIPTERSGPHPEIEYRKSEAVARTLDELGIDQVDVVGHSEASMIIGLGAMHDEHRFRNLVFLNPAGLGGPDSPVQLAQRSLREVGRQTLEGVQRLAVTQQTGQIAPQVGRSMKVFHVTMKSIMQNPQSIWSSIVAGGQIDTTDMLRELRAAGHKIAIIHGVEDEMLPMKNMMENVKPDMVDGFYSVRGGHASLFNDPDSFNLVIDEALDALERRSPKLH